MFSLNDTDARFCSFFETVTPVLMYFIVLKGEFTFLGRSYMCECILLDLKRDLTHQCYQDTGR